MGQNNVQYVKSWILAAVLTDHGWSLPFLLSMLPNVSMCLIRSQSILLIQFLARNSRIIWTALQPFSECKILIKILSSLVNGAIFINQNYITDDVTEKIFNKPTTNSIVKYSLKKMQKFDILSNAGTLTCWKLLLIKGILLFIGTPFTSQTCTISKTKRDTGRK